jgi:ABC-type nitrate/sulfonate/bicarbonate transport system substrate-binding protein
MILAFRNIRLENISKLLMFFQTYGNIMAQTVEIWGVKDPNVSAQLALAQTLNLFKREADLDVTCTWLESGTIMADQVAEAGREPFALTQTPITTLRLREYGIFTKIVAPLADIAATQQVIVREASGISTPADLHGKNVGVAQGAAVLLALKNMAKDCDVNINTLRFVDLLPQEQLEAFKAGQLDVIAAWEPWTTKARAMGGAFYFSGTQSDIPGIEGEINWLINQSCLIVPETRLHQQPEQVIAVLNVLRKATTLLNDHREKMVHVLADFFALSPAELFAIMQKNRYSLAVTNLFRLGILGFRDFLYDGGQISEKYAEHDLYDLHYLRQVDRSLVLLEETLAEQVHIVEKDGIYYRDDFTLHSDNGQPPAFLLADDSRYIRALLAKAVEYIGGQVVGEATTGSEIIEQFAHTRSDVITMDLSMPGVSGLEAIKIILQIDPDVSIVVVSGTDLDEVREEVFNLGVKMFITKPFDATRVATVLADAIES